MIQDYMQFLQSKDSSTVRWRRFRVFSDPAEKTKNHRDVVVFAPDEVSAVIIATQVVLAGSWTIESFEHPHTVITEGDRVRVIGNMKATPNVEGTKMVDGRYELLVMRICGDGDKNIG